MVEVVIRLVGEKKDRLFDKICLERQISRTALIKQIEIVTHIPPEFQQVQICGKSLPITCYPLESINQFEELVVKHSDLPRWNLYKNCVKMISKKCANKQKLANDAVRYHEILTASGFFNVYAKFDNYQNQKHSGVAAWADGEVNLIQKSSEQYFHHLHDLKRRNQNSEFVCNFEEPNLELTGRSRSILAFVRIHGKDSVSKYYVKCHHNNSERRRSSRPPEIRELYCYKLLELIGVGSKCHIIPPSTTIGTQMNMYIATEWNDNFELLDDLIEEENLSADTVVQLVLLRVLLFVTDLHERNCGVWKGTKDVAVVDFATTEDFKVYRNIKDEVLTTFPSREWIEIYTAVKNQHDDNSWLKIAKTYLDRWDVASKIQLALEQFDPTNIIRKRVEIGLNHRWRSHNDPTEELNEYMDTLKENLENLQILLNSI